jgi:hypothetical protein
MAGISAFQAGMIFRVSGEAEAIVLFVFGCLFCDQYDSFITLDIKHPYCG